MKYLERTNTQTACFPECGVCCPYLALGPKCSGFDSVSSSLYAHIYIYIYTPIWPMRKLRHT